jgi:FkbM family methyltransferase
MQKPGFIEKLKFFRPRRYIFGRHGRNPLIRRLGRWMEKNAEAYRNIDRNMGRNGEVWLMKMLARHFAANNSAGHKDAEPFVAFDVGANSGEWSSYMYHLDPTAEIHAFELVPDTFQRLQQSLGGVGNIHCRPFGLSNKKARVEIFLNSSSETAGLFSRVGLSAPDTITGEVQTGADYMAAEKIARIDLLKIDTEGAEKIVLEGFGAHLKNNMIDVIYFEYGEFNIAARTLLQDFYTLLGDYEIGRLMPAWVEFGPYDKNLEDFRAANYVAVRRDRQDLIKLLG